MNDHAERAASRTTTPDRPLRIAMVDPSLFTLPYDRMLAAGLEAGGQAVTLYGRAPRPDDGDPGALRIEPLFYRLAGHPILARGPNALRLAVKAVDHALSMRRLARRLAVARPDVIHLQWLPLPVLDGPFLKELRRAAPLVLTLHDSEPFNGNASARLQAAGIGRCYALCDRIIVHTRQGQDRLEALGIPAARIVRLPHGPLDPVPPVTDAPADAMAGEITLTLFGKIKPYKGVDLLLEAFAGLPPALRDQARIRVVGKPYMDLDPLAARAAALGVADRFIVEPRFVPDDEVARIFGPGVVAVFPYREIEASGVMTLALAHGRPIIAARLGAFAETLTDGAEGLLVPPGDSDALRAALARMIGDRDLARRAAAASRGLAARLPDWEEIGRRTVAVYGAARRDWSAAHGA